MATVSFTPSESDVVEANKLWFRSELRTRGNLLFLFGGALLCALVGSFFASGRGLIRIILGAGIGVIIWLAVFCLIVGTIRVWLPRGARKQFTRQPFFHRETQLTWSEESITMKTANGYSRHGWDEFGKWAESRDVFALFFTDGLFTYIPKRALSLSEAEELRSILRRNLG